MTCHVRSKASKHIESQVAFFALIFVLMPSFNKQFWAFVLIANEKWAATKVQILQFAGPRKTARDIYAPHHGLLGQNTHEIDIIDLKIICPVSVNACQETCRYIFGHYESSANAILWIAL